MFEKLQSICASGELADIFTIISSSKTNDNMIGKMFIMDKNGQTYKKHGDVHFASVVPYPGPLASPHEYAFIQSAQVIFSDEVRQLCEQMFVGCMVRHGPVRLRSEVSKFLQKDV